MDQITTNKEQETTDQGIQAEVLQLDSRPGSPWLPLTPPAFLILGVGVPLKATVVLEVARLRDALRKPDSRARSHHLA